MTTAGTAAPAARRAPPRLRRPAPLAGRVAVVAAAMLLLLWSGILLAIRGEMRAAGRDALRDTANMARTLEAQIAGRIEAIDARLRIARALWARDPDGFRFGAWPGLDPTVDLPVAVILGPGGEVRPGGEGQPDLDPAALASLGGPPGQPVPDRLQISPPFEGGAGQRRLVAFSRPLLRDGAQAGAVLVGVDAASFSRLYQTLALDQGAILLVGLDGVIRAWGPGHEEVVGNTIPLDSVAALRDGRAVQLSGRMTGAADGVDRFMTWRRVADQPLIVSVGRSAEAVLATARADRHRLLLLGALLTVLILAVGVMLGLRRRAADQARAELEAAIGHISQGVITVDPAGRIAVVNARAEELLGLPPGIAVPGRPMRDLVAWQVEAGEFGGGPPPEAIFRSLSAPAGAPPDRQERVRPNGTVLEIRTEHLADGSHVRTYTDLTAPRRAAEILAEARDRAVAAEEALAATVENVPHGVLMVDAANRVVIMTRRALEMLELPEALGRPGTDVRELHRFQVGRGDLARAPDIGGSTTRMLLAERPAVIPTYERELRSGRVVEVRTTVLGDGRAVRTYTDITERRAAAQAQEEARLAAEANMRARTDFLAMVSHELRTPLHAVIGLSGLLLEETLPEAQAQNLRTIRAAGEHLLALVDDLLDVTRLERGDLPLQDAPYDLRETLRGAVALVARRAEERGLALALEVAPAVPAWLLGDAARLRQVVLNLLDNAVKFTDAGRIAVAAEVAETAAGPRLRLTVSDSGMGIPPEAQARLFDAFVQGEGGATRRYGGAGLGLAICRMLLERMGGGIGVESAPAAGSTFRCDLPLRPAVPARPAAEGAPLRVLVAEDIAANRLLLTQTLARLGHAVEAVENGAEAVAALRERRFDLVLMDVMMPVLDGIAATRAIRALPGPAADTPVIMLTAHALPEVEAEALSAGADRFETKPIGPAALRAAIGSVLEGRAAA